MMGRKGQWWEKERYEMTEEDVESFAEFHGNRYNLKI